ncbi:hypothetical protein LCGC14_0146990 [marine sediment metagenome]|uniref:Uncharacterized protein n=1 Tax=marine sediment metagenome TaxID=412755 RepID=A0A0F9VFL8_9ZZZZ
MPKIPTGGAFSRFWQGFKSGPKAEVVGTAAAQTMATMPAAIIGSILGGGVVVSGQVAAESIGGAIQKSRSYKAMLNHSPELAKKVNRDKVEKYFNSIWNFNPQVARDPIASSAAVKRMLGVHDEEHLELLTGMGKMYQEPKPFMHPGTQAIMSGTLSAGLGAFVPKYKDLHPAPTGVRRPENFPEDATQVNQTRPGGMTKSASARTSFLCNVGKAFNG